MKYPFRNLKCTFKEKGLEGVGQRTERYLRGPKLSLPILIFERGYLRGPKLSLPIFRGATFEDQSCPCQFLRGATSEDRSCPCHPLPKSTFHPPLPAPPHLQNLLSEKCTSPSIALSLPPHPLHHPLAKSTFHPPPLLSTPLNGKGAPSH